MSVSGSISFDEVLLVQPKILSPARIGARLQLIASDLRGLARESHLAVPVLRHVDVQQDSRRQAFGQHQRNQNARKLRRGFEIEILFAIGHGNCDGGDVIDGAFHRGAHRAGVVDVLAHVSAAIDSGDDQVGLLLEDGVEGQDHGVRGRAFDRVFIRRDLVHVDRLAQCERLGAGAAFVRGRDDRDVGLVLERVNERAQTGSVDAVIVGN